MRDRVVIVLLAVASSIGVYAIPAAAAEAAGTPVPGPTSAADDAVIPAAQGVFSPTGSLPQGEWSDSAITLHDGRVLVIGLSTRSRATAHLWDPTTGKFTETGLPPMWVLAWNATTLLDDGRVLIMGSYSEARDAAVWDPATGEFTETGSLSVLRGGGHATLLDDGRVFVFNGTRAEVWDADSGAFTPLDAVSTLERRAKALVTLEGGRVLVFGSECSERDCRAAAEIWDVDAASVAAVQPKPRHQSPRTGCGVTAATPLLDGRILVTTCGRDRSRAFTWDPTSGRFTPAGRLHHAGSAFSATRLLDGRVLVAGGAGRSGDANDEAEIWDPATGEFAPTGSMSVGRADAGATLLQDGRVLIVGGYHQAGEGTDGIGASDLTSAEVFELVP